MTWGPFKPGLPEVERVARLRCLRAAARLLCGPRAAELAAKLRAAETDHGAADAAQAEFNRLGTIDQRRILAAFAAVT